MKKIALQQLLLLSAALLAVFSVYGQEEVNGEESGELTFRQQILMPGPLVSGHAKYENKCETCHTSFEKQAMQQLCIDCHEDIAEDRTSKMGFHGQAPLASNNSCETCHKDHNGRDADIMGLLSDSFDHQFARFNLEGSHEHLACQSCHEDGLKYREAPNQCFGCHEDRDIHNGALGEKCETCHQASAWQSRLEFNHHETDFPLKGEHNTVACSGCHIAQKFEFEDTGCASCHRSQDVHLGGNGDQCQDCHSEKGWDELAFDHDKTDFPLRNAHTDVACISCHAPNTDRSETSQACNSCHAGADIHQKRNGEKCETCHTTITWDKPTFDHNKDTDFILDGKHTDALCTQCHTGHVEDQLPRDCAGCHKADDVHKTEDMSVCGTCHNTEGWDFVTRFDHDFTHFPLIGMHQIVPCQNCHIGNQFAGTEHGCKTCHEKDDVHNDSLGENCNQCHTPNAWDIWQFDHEKDADYPLEGKHEDLACDACHLPGTSPDNTNSECGSCHRRQDIHNGGFGSNCGRCHGVNNFNELLIH